jgi:lipoprotein NlpI
LGEIALRQGDKNRFTNHVNAALHNASDLLVRGSADPDDRAELHLERGRMFFLLGDTRQAMDDFRQAQALAPDNPRTYADPLRMVVSHGFYVEAHQMFERAMSQQRLPDGLKLYFSLWMNELALRQSQQPDTTATAFLDRYRATPWGVELAKHARGELAFDKLFARASDRGEKAEAYFYEGLRQWRLGDRQRAKALMQSVINTQMMDFAEYDMAQSYLEWGELPQTARAPMALSHTR